MQRLFIKDIEFNDRKIKLYPGVNYIVGDNASGKTTFFNLLLYIFGLNANLLNKINFNKIKINFNIDSGEYSIERETDSNSLVIKSEGITFQVQSNDKRYNQILNEWFKPMLSSMESNSSIKNILRSSFMSGEIEYSKKETNLVMLGIDNVYERQNSKHIKDLLIEVNTKKKELDLLKSYQKDIIILFNEKYNNQSDIEIRSIVDQAYDNYEKSYLHYFELYQKSKDLLNNLEIENRRNEEYIVEELNFQFQEIISNFSLNKIHFKDALYGKYDFYSMGQRTLIDLICRLIIQSNFNFTNGVGLLVNDNQSLDDFSYGQINKIIEGMCNKNKLQYIEFVHSNREINKDRVIFTLSKGNII